MKPEMKSLSGSKAEGLLDSFLEEASLTFKTSNESIPIIDWVQTIDLGGRKFTFQGHEYQKAILEENAQRQVLKKGAQVGFSECQILKSLHGLIYGQFPQGVLYLFPTQNDVYDYSRARFTPLILENPSIAAEVKDTESVSLKRVRKAHLYLRGGRATSKIEGIKKMSSQLIAISVDRICYDEQDFFDPAMIELSLERMSHSAVKQEVYLGTPSVPAWGCDRLYSESDQRVWEIKCSHCSTGTVLELEWPNSLLELSDGRVIRACKKCKQEIYPKDGRWVAQYPGRDLVGWWISQLNSIYVDPGKILRAFNDANKRNLQEFYNSKLGMAWISAENRLTVQDVYANCGQSPMLTRANGPSCMGVDVGSLLHVVVAYKPREEVLQVCYLAQVSSFNDLHDIARRFNVQCGVVDFEPETRKAREWQASEEFPVFLCDYVSTITEGSRWDEEKKTLKVNRTESLDGVHQMIANSGLIVFPRRSEETEEFAKQLVNIAKVLEEDQETGSREYRYRKLGEDHYAHALNYCILASSKISTMIDPWGRERPRQTVAISDFDPFSYNQKKGTHYPGDPQTHGEGDWNPFGR